MSKLDLTVPQTDPSPRTAGPGFAQNINTDFALIQSAGAYTVRAAGDGASFDTAAFLAKASELTPGSTLLIPEPEVEYVLDQPIPITVDGVSVVFQGERTPIRQTTWGSMVFDLFDVDGCTIQSFLARYTGARTTIFTPYRGDGKYATAAAIYTNGSYHTFEDIWVEGLAMGITLSNWDSGAGAFTGQREGNTVRDLHASGIDHGLLFYAQKGLRVMGVRTKDHSDSSSHTNPNHAIYATNPPDWSEDILISDGICENNPGCHAFQLKHVKGGIVKGLVAKGCGGVLNLLEAQELNISHLRSRATTDYSTSPFGVSDVGALTMQNVSEKKLSVSDVWIEMTAPGRGATLRGDDSEFSDIHIELAQGGFYSNENYALLWTGNRARMGKITLDNKGSGTSRGIEIGGTGDQLSSYLRLAGPYAALNLRNAGDVVDNQGHVVHHKPSLCQLTDPSVPSWGGIGGGARYELDRGQRRVVTIQSAAGNITPDPTAGNFLDISVATAGAVGILPPHAICDGLIVDIAILNSTGGALAITWDAIYVMKSAWTTPAAGKRVTSRFFFDGTNWVEIGRY